MLLLVDDDDLFRAALADNLRDDGYKVEEYNTTRAIPIPDLRNVSALLIDWVIEQRSGQGFIKRFHEAYPSVPVIVITANGKHAQRSAADSHLTFLPKPLSYDVLVEALGSGVPHPQI